MFTLYALPPQRPLEGPPDVFVTVSGKYEAQRWPSLFLPTLRLVTPGFTGPGSAGSSRGVSIAVETRGFGWFFGLHISMHQMWLCEVHEESDNRADPGRRERPTNSISTGLVGLLREALSVTPSILNIEKKFPAEREERKRTKGDKGARFALRYEIASLFGHFERLSVPCCD